MGVGWGGDSGGGWGGDERSLKTQPARLLGSVSHLLSPPLPRSSHQGVIL